MLGDTMLVFSVISSQAILTKVTKIGEKMEGNVSRETIEAPSIGNDTWQSTLFGGEIQPGKPDSESQEVQGGSGNNKREHDRQRQRKSRKKREDKQLIQALIEQVGFFGFYKSSHVFVHYNSNIWDPPTYGWAYHQDRLKELFAGDVPTMRQVLLLLVAGIPDEKARATLPLINYLTRTRPFGEGNNGDYLGEYDFSKWQALRGGV